MYAVSAKSYQPANSNIKESEYKGGGYTEKKLITSGKIGIKQKDGTTFYAGFYIAPNGKYYLVITSTLKSSGDGKCNPNYSACVSNVHYDLDFRDISTKSFLVIGYDQCGLDGAGDGIACESYMP